MFDRICKIIFIRHGSTIYTDQNRLYDIDDYPPINDKGKKEMEKITSWLKACNSSIDMIYTSSTLRSIQSARILAKGFRKDFEILDNLYEKRTGIWGGLTFKQIEEKYPEMLEKYHKNPCSFWPEGGETTIEVNTRVKETIDRVVKENFQKRLIIIAPSGVIQSAISLALGIPPEFQTRVYIPTGSATQVNYYHEWTSLVYSAYIPA